MKYLLTILAFCCFAFVQTQAQTQYFLGSLEELQKKVKKEKKMYFVVFHADWCQPCKKMEREVFADMEVGNFVKRNFEAFRVDGEKGFYEYMAKDYWVTAYPTIIIFDSEGEEKGRITGFRDKEGLLDELKKYVPGMEKNQFSEFR